MNTPTKVITHTAQSQTWHTVRDVDSWHRQRWPGFVSRSGWHVGYHIVIEWDGTWTQTREFDEEGAHCIGQNKSSIGVCFMGNGDLHEPSPQQKSAWVHEVWALIHKQYPTITTSDIYPHRAFANKTCHGRLLSDNYYAELVGEVLRSKIKELTALLNRLLALFANRRM